MPQRNLLVFGFHLDFLEINQESNFSYAAFSADCNVCVDILIESETLGSQSRLTKERQTLSETSPCCQYFMHVLQFRPKRATSIESKCRPKGFGTRALFLYNICLWATSCVRCTCQFRGGHFMNNKRADFSDV